jgi:hypothetical protein
VLSFRLRSSEGHLWQVKGQSADRTKQHTAPAVEGCFHGAGLPKAIGEKILPVKHRADAAASSYLTTISPLYERDGVKWMVNEKPSRVTRAS